MRSLATRPPGSGSDGSQRTQRNPYDRRAALRNRRSLLIAGTSPQPGTAWRVRAKAGFGGTAFFLIFGGGTWRVAGGTGLIDIVPVPPTGTAGTTWGRPTSPTGLLSSRLLS